MRRKLTLICSVSLLCSVLLPGARYADAQLTPPGTDYKVGVIVGATGPIAAAGQAMIRGLELADKEDAAGIQLIIEDDKGLDIRAAVSALQKLTAVDKTVAVLDWSNTTMHALAPIATASKTPIIEFWDSNRGMLGMSNYIFCTGLSTELSAERMARYAIEKRGNKKIAIITLEDTWSELISEAFVAEAKRLGAEIVLHEKVAPGASDLRSLLLKVRASSAHGVFAPLFAEPLYALLRQRKESGIDLPVYTGDGFTEGDLPIVKNYGEGVYSLQLILNDPDFAARYEKAFGLKESPITLGYAGLAYDGFKTLEKAIVELKRKRMLVTRESITATLRDMEYQGVTGLATPGKESTKVEQVVVIKDGRFVPAE